MAKKKGGGKPPEKKPDDKKPENPDAKSHEQKDADDQQKKIEAWEKEGRDNGTKEYNEVYPRMVIGWAVILGIITAIWFSYWIVAAYKSVRNQEQQQPQQEEVVWPTS